MDIPSLFIALVAVSFTLALITGVVAYRSELDGLTAWAWALMLHGVAYLLYLLRGQVSDWLSIVLANVALSLAVALFAAGVAGFQRRRLSPWLIWAPVGVVALVFSVFLDDTRVRIATNGLVTALQCLLIITLLWQGRRSTPGRGQYVLMGALLTVMLMFVVRTAMVGAGQVQVVTVQASNTLQSATFLVSIVCLVIMGQGLVLMSAERAVQRNLQMAMRDELTGLSNRRFILEALQQQLSLARRTGQPLSLLVIDADHFKRVNDTHGHLVGDEVLRTLSSLIQARLRSHDVAGRFGGEEFLVILPHTATDGAAKVAESLRQTVAEAPLALAGGQRLSLSVSIGVAERREDSLRADDLIHAADAALYRAKQAGRNRVEIAG